MDGDGRSREELAAEVQALRRRIRALEKDGEAGPDDLLTRYPELVQTERALRESETKYRDLVEKSHDLVWQCDTEGRFTFVNAACEECLGYTPDEMIGRCLTEFKRPAEAQRTMQAFQKILGGVEVHDFDTVYLSKSGEEVWLLFNAARIVDSDGNVTGTGGTAHNITDRRRAEKALKRERDRARSYLDVAGTMILSLNAEGKVTLVNRKGCEILGRDEKDVVGKDWFNTFLPEEERKEVRAIFDKLMRGEMEGVEYFENSIITAHGERREIGWHNVYLRDDAGRIVGTLASAADISDRKRVQAELQFRAQILEGLKEGVNFVDADAGTILHVNPSFEEMFGYGPGELVGKHVSVLNAPSDEGAAKTAARVMQSLKKDGRWTGEINNIRKDGTAFWSQARVGAMDHPEHGKIWVSVQEDITDRKRAEARLQEALAQTEERRKEVAALNGASRAVLHAADFEEAAQSIFEYCKGLLGATAGYVALLSKDGSENEVLFLDAGGRTCTVDTSLPMPIRGLRAEAYRTGKPVFDNGFARSEWARFLPGGHVTLENVLFAPLMIERKAVGLLGLANKPGGFSTRDPELASTFGELAAVALLNSRALASLRESEEKYRALVENFPDFLLRLDRQHRYVYVSPSAAKSSPIPPEDFIGKTHRELGYPEDVCEYWEREVQKVFDTGRPIQGQFELEGRSGLRVLDWTVVPEFAKDGSVATVLSISRDVTERKRAEDALRLDAAILRNVPEGVYLIGLDDGIIKYANPEFEQMFGYDPGEMVGKYVAMVNAPTAQTPEETKAGIVSILRETGEWHGEIENIRKDGTRFWCHANVSLFDHPEHERVIVSVHTDITDRKRAEESLRESEERFRLMVMNSPDMTLIQNADGTGTYLSPQTLEVTGLPAEKLLGGGFPDIIHPDDLDAVHEAYDRAVSGEELVDFRYRVIDPEGKARWMSHTARPIVKDGKLTAIQSNIRNITERERMAESLRWELAVNRSLADLSAALIDPSRSTEEIANVVLQSARELTGSEHGYVSSIDPATGDNVSHTLTQMLPTCPVKGENRRTVFSPGPDGVYPGLWGHSLNTREGFFTNSPATHEKSSGVPEGHVELRSFLSVPAVMGDQLMGQISLANTDGGYTDRHLDTVRRLAELYAVAVYRKRAEEEIADIARFPSDNPSPVLRVSGDGLILHANPASRSLLDAWKVGEGDRVPGDVATKVAESLGTGVSLEMDVATPDHIYSFVLAPVRGEDYVNLYGRDVTEHRKLEEQLLHTQKMEAIGTLAGGIAHDFNNLLQAILGYSNMLKMTALSPGDRAFDAVDVIEKAAVRAADLTKQLLGFARRGKLQITPVDMHHVINSTIAILARTIDKRIGISLRLMADPAIVMGDPSQLEQVIMNLAVNARDAMPEGGELLCQTANVVLDDDYCRAHAEVTPGSYLLVGVNDTGVGMSDEVRERVFDPFFTTKERGEGTGMGLAMVYGIAKNHGGSVCVYSEPGAGTTFKLYLPMAEGAKRPSDTQKLPALVQGSGTILLVDDEESVRQNCTDMLTSLGYEVVSVEDGDRAVEYYRQHTDGVDLVVLDMTMPGMDGKECFEQLKALDPEVKVVLATGHALNGAAQHIMDAGALRFLQKPFILAQLSEAVAKALRHDPTKAGRGRDRQESANTRDPAEAGRLRDALRRQVEETLRALVSLQSTFAERGQAAPSIPPVAERLRRFLRVPASEIDEVSVRHDLGGAIVGIEWFTKGLKQNLPEGDALRGAAEAAGDAARRASELMREQTDTSDEGRARNRV